jgi:hypothetical protein
MIAPLFLILGLASSPVRDSLPRLRVELDSAHHRIVVTGGPFRLPASDPEMEHMGHEAMDLAMPITPVQRFSWPNRSWLRGFHVALLDGQGRPLPRRLLHHLIVVNFGRRMLFYPGVERLMGIAAETEVDGYTVPKSLGVPMESGLQLGVYAMWRNETGTDIPEAYWRLIIEWLPTNLQPRPIEVLPAYVDVNLHLADSNTFVVPPGRSEHTYTFSPPISGHLLAVSGHLHDYGVALRLEDAATGRVLVTLRAKRDSAGHVLDVPRKLLAMRGEGLHLDASRRYRLVGVYDNPTADTVPGAMANLVGLFAPVDYGRWPAIDSRDPVYRKDLDDLLRASQLGTR